VADFEQKRKKNVYFFSSFRNGTTYLYDGMETVKLKISKA